MQDLFATHYLYLIPLLPLIAAAVVGLFGARGLKQQSHWPIWIGVGISAVISISLLIGMLGQWSHLQHTAHEAGATVHQVAPSDQKFPLSLSQNLFTWIAAGNFTASMGFFIDPLTAVMLCVVTGIGFFITVFAKGYMAGEEGYFRFFAYLGLFIFAMTMLVMGNNFLLLYLGWEGVGLCSYLLIGYYYDKPAAREAAKKAFLVNRVGDFGFGVGIMLIFYIFGTISYFGDGAGTMTGVLELVRNPMAVPGMTPEKLSLIPWIPFLLMIGAFGKSAQFPLYVWLPDAMEGPTPVSALIHAATMVTAGVYMIARCSTLFVASHAALLTVAVIGAFTAIFAATIALRQFDLKKVFAYSTISQLGFMFAALGVLAPVAGVFHLVTHAFFKALLFLSSGVVMHAMAGELDMRKMSGLKRVLPWTNRFMLVGCAALAGFPLLSGFFSKDEILHAAFHQNFLIGLVLLITAFITAYYTFRLYFRVFQGPEVIPAGAGGHGHAHDHDAADAHAHASASAVHAGDAGHSGVDQHLAHDSHSGHGHNHEPLSMMLPLAVLAIGAILAGLLNWPERHSSLGHFLGQSPSFIQGYERAVEAHGGEAAGHSAVEAPAFGQEAPRHEAEAGTAEAVHPLFTPIMGVSAVVSLLGIWVAYMLHLKNRAASDRLAEKLAPVSRLLEAKYWVDEVYQAGIVEPLRRLGRGFFAVDQYVVDGLVWLVSFIPQLSGFTLKYSTQRGYLQGYAVKMLLGIPIILLIIFLKKRPSDRALSMTRVKTV